MTDLQARLEAIYCPPLDSSLVAAIAHDEGQTLQSAKEVLDTLAGDVQSASSEVPASLSDPPSPTTAAEQSMSSSASTHPTSPESVQRMLDEFHLGEELEGKQDATEKAENLQLTDEEGEESGTKDYPAYRQESNVSNSSGSLAKDPLAFLSHAFSTRTRTFLEETLSDCHGDVGLTIDTLMAIDLAEREEMESTVASETSGQSGPSASAPGSSIQKGLDLDALANGSAARSAKGKKGRAMRKKAHEEHLRSMGSGYAPVKNITTKVTLGDVRQGGKDWNRFAKIQNGRAGSLQGSESKSDGQIGANLHGLSDAEIAQLLAKEEDPDAGETVRDNQWLLTSSILSQLSDLLEIPPMVVTSAYNKASFNLHIAVGRLIDSTASEYPTLESLEKAGSAPSGTAAAIVDSLSSLSGKGTAVVELCLRATKGKQDATLDLLNLMTVVRDASGTEQPDELDPLGKLREDVGEDAAAAKRRAATEAQSSQLGFSVPSSSAADLNPLPGEAVDWKALDAARKAGGYSRATVAGRTTAPVGRSVAMASLQSGNGAITFPPSAAQNAAGSAAGLPTATRLMFSEGSGGFSDTAYTVPTTIRQREEAIQHFRALATEYQERRNRCLVQASQAWRAAPNNSGRGAAFYYADEARRLEAKSRAWNLKAAEALVEYRRMGGADGPSAAAAAGRRGVVDLHGVTVRDALSIVKEHLDRWYYALPVTHPDSVAKLKALTIVTGAGRHSPNQVAILTPSVAKYLQREGWKADVNRHSGVITVRGR